MLRGRAPGRGRGLRRLAAVLFCLLAFTSCAGRGDVEVLDSDALPADLYGGRPRSQDAPRTLRARVFLTEIDERRLVPVSRTVENTRLPVAEAAMRELLRAGRTQADVDAGIGNAIPGDTELFSISVDDNVATVNLSGQFEQVARDWVFLLRIAQVVWTLTELPDVDAVRFRIHWVDTEVIDQDGKTHDVVGRARYSRFAPEGMEASLDPCTLVESVEGCEPTPSP